MKKRKRLDRVIAGTKGMALISGNTAYVSNEKRYGGFILMQQPASFIIMEHDFFETIGKNRFHIREEIRDMSQKMNNKFLAMLMIVQVVIFIILLNTSVGNPRRAGIGLIFYGFSILLDTCISNRMKIKAYDIEKIVARKKCALYKAVNAYYKLKRVPTLDEIKKASYKPTGKICMTPLEVSGIFICLFGIAVVIANLYIIVIVIGILLILLLKFKMYNLLIISQMDKPADYELNEARALLDYYDSLLNTTSIF